MKKTLSVCTLILCVVAFFTQPAFADDEEEGGEPAPAEEAPTAAQDDSDQPNQADDEPEPEGNAHQAVADDDKADDDKADEQVADDKPDDNAVQEVADDKPDEQVADDKGDDDKVDDKPDEQVADDKLDDNEEAAGQNVNAIGANDNDDQDKQDNEDDNAAVGATADENDSGASDDNLSEEQLLEDGPATVDTGIRLDTPPADFGEQPQKHFLTEEAAEKATAERLGLSDAARADYAEMLRQFAKAIRGKVTEKIAARIDAKQADKMRKVTWILFFVSLSGVLLLAMPLLLRKKYPTQGRILWKYSAMSAGMFFVAINLFTVVLVTMRTSQGALGKYTNPQLRIVESTFDMVEDKAEDLAEIGPVLIEPTLSSLTGKSDEPVLSIMLSNVQKFKSDFQVFTQVANFFKKLNFIFGLIPLVLLAVSIFLFLKVAKPTLMEIVKLPEKAAQGGDGAGKATFAYTMRNVLAEGKATLCAIGILTVLTVLSGGLLGYVLEPAIETFVNYLATAFMYVQLVDHASSFWVMFSLVATIMFLVLNLAIVIMASTFFLGKAQKILQAKFREGVPLSSHAQFWKWGSVSTVWAHVLPVLFILAASPGIGWLVRKSIDKYIPLENPAGGNWSLILASGPALFVATLLASFWLFRGFSALVYLAKYKVGPAKVQTPPDQPKSRTEQFLKQDFAAPAPEPSAF